MPSLTSVSTVWDQLETDVRAAWTDVSAVFKSRPRTVPAVPYACINLMSVEQSFEAAVKEVRQSFSFEIVGVWRYDPAKSIAEQQIERADALLARLEASSVYAGEAMMPLASTVSFQDSDEIDECYEIRLEFTAFVFAEFGS